MDITQIKITLDGDRERFAPGDELAGAISLGMINIHDVRAMELSVLWHTEGKGDEDIAVHFFQRTDVTGEQPRTPEPHRFRLKLPLSPLSYDGLIVKIRWCVRLRIFPAIGKEVVVDRRFCLGSIPPPRDAARDLTDESADAAEMRTA